MLSILAGAALGAYTLKSLIGLSRDVAVTKAVGGVKNAVHEAIEETKAGFVEGVARAKAQKAAATTGGSGDDAMAKIFAAASDEDKAKIVEIISKYSNVDKAA